MTAVLLDWYGRLNFAESVAAILLIGAGVWRYTERNPR